MTSNDQILCDEHGQQTCVGVCCHVAESVRGGPVEGFELDQIDGEYQAKCKACGDSMVELSGADRAAFIDSTLVVICFGCFVKAAAVNGVKIDT